MSKWKQEAERLFFDGGLSIVEISPVIGVSVKSISAHFNTLPNYITERSRRKEANSNRTAYYRKNKRKSRRLAAHNNVSAETLKQEHIAAVKILSKERFFR